MGSRRPATCSLSIQAWAVLVSLAAQMVLQAAAVEAQAQTLDQQHRLDLVP